MLERLEQQRRLTSNHWKLILTGNVVDLLDFFDFFQKGRDRRPNCKSRAKTVAGRPPPSDGAGGSRWPRLR